MGVYGAAERQRTVVGALHEGHRGVREQRTEQARDVVGAEPDEVGVDEDDQVAGGRRHRLPQRLTLARPVAELRKDLVLAHDLGAGLARLRRPSRRVDPESTTRTWSTRPESVSALQLGHDRADGRGLVARREHDADPAFLSSAFSAASTAGE